jgi:REP element-mobilizing transposase RayT
LTVGRLFSQFGSDIGTDIGSDKNMWNDTDVPLAYLITFRSYGTWLHGDERGSVDHVHNRVGTPYAPPDQRLHDRRLTQLKSEPLVFGARQRASVEKSIRETCALRGWGLMAVNVRTNHVHTVVAAGDLAPESILKALKARATTQMRTDNCWTHEHSPWVEGGSKRYLWNERSVGAAVEYVVNGQGGPLPDLG